MGSTEAACATGGVRLRTQKRLQQEWQRSIHDAQSEESRTRFAAAEGYPSRHLHNLFLEAHWHWIFGEPERYQPPFELYSHLPFVTGVVPDVTGSVPEWMRRRAAMRYWGPGQQKGLSAAAGWDKGGKRPCSRP